MTASKNATRMRRLFDRGWTDGDLTVVDEIVDEEFVFSRQGVSGEGGPDQYRDLITATREVFPDMAYTIEDVEINRFADGSLVETWTPKAGPPGFPAGLEVFCVS